MTWSPQLGLRQVPALAQLAQPLREAFQRFSHLQHSCHPNFDTYARN